MAIKKQNINNTNVQTKDYQQLTDMPAPEQFKPTNSYFPIVCKINPNSSHEGLRTTVHHKQSYNKDTTYVMGKTAFKYSFFLIPLCKDPMSEIKVNDLTTMS